MKSPSKNISESLRGQRVPGRAPLEVPAPTAQTGGVSMIIPGNGKVEQPPAAEHYTRTVSKYAAPMRRFGGG